MELNHISIKANAALLEQVKDFYCNALDLKVGFRPEFDMHGYWLYSGDRALVHLMESSQALQAHNDGHLDHIAFASTNLEAMLQRLKKLNLQYRSAYLPDINMTLVFVHDPAGNKLEINFTGERE